MYLTKVVWCSIGKFLWKIYFEESEKGEKWTVLNFWSPVITLCATGINIQNSYFIPTKTVYVSCVVLRLNLECFFVRPT